MGTKQFTDVYFDTSSCALATTDCWLRRREQQWELKVPAGEAARSGGERTSFTEIEGAAAVAAALASRALIPAETDISAFETALREAGLAPL